MFTYVVIFCIPFPFRLFPQKGDLLGEKDISEKLLADYEDVFADIVNVLLFHGEKRVTPASLLATQTISHYKADDSRLHEQERDILKAWTDGQIQIALIGLENQTLPERKMPVRIFGYEGANYRSQLDHETIVPVISLVLYFGTERRWQKPRNLKALLNIPDGLEDYVNDFHIHVFEIAWLPDEQINQFTSDFGIVARYFSELRKNKDYIPDDTRVIRHVDAVLKLLAVMSGDRRYEQILAPAEQKGEVTTMYSVAQRLEEQGMKKGIEKGIERGRAQERIELLVSLCKAGHISIDIAAAEMHISREKFQEYLDGKFPEQ